eukprot:4970503-Prymnesium_polylepis.1
MREDMTNYSSHALRVQSDRRSNVGLVRANCVLDALHPRAQCEEMVNRVHRDAGEQKRAPSAVKGSSEGQQ